MKRLFSRRNDETVFPVAQKVPLLEAGMLYRNLRKAGGSTIVPLPPAILYMIGMEAGDRVSLDVKRGKIVIARADPRRSVRRKRGPPHDDESR